MAKNIIIILLLVILAMGVHGKYLTYNITTQKEVVTEIRTDTLTMRDTVVVPDPYPVYREKYMPIDLPTAYVDPVTQVPDTVSVVLPYHQYRDTITQDSATFTYDIITRGYMDRFSYELDVPVRTVTHTTTVTHTKHRTIDLHLIGGVAHNPYIGVDLSYKRHKVGYRRDLPVSSLVPGAHHIEYGYRLWDL